MGKVIFEFDTDTEAVEIRTHVYAVNWKSLAWSLDGYLRDMVKYSENNVEQYEKARDMLHELMSDHNLSFDD
jgi:hypothetical protein